MPQCKNIGCSHEINPMHDLDYCVECLMKEAPTQRQTNKSNTRSFSQGNTGVLLEAKQSSGGDNDYWLVDITHPKRLKAYTAECEDIIEALGMTFQEGEAFKAIWRKCADRFGNGKPGDTPLRNAQKVAHFGQRMVAIETRALSQEA